MFQAVHCLYYRKFPSYVCNQKIIQLIFHLTPQRFFTISIGENALCSCISLLTKDTEYFFSLFDHFFLLQDLQFHPIQRIRFLRAY